MKQRLVSERKKLLLTFQKLIEGPMVLLGFLWLILVIVELVWGLPHYLQVVSVVIWVLFIIDFLVKLLLAPFKVEFVKKNLLTVVSLIVPAFRLFRLLRVFRLLRGVRVVKVIGSLNRTMKSLGATMARRGFAYVVLLALVVIFGGAAGMYAIEKGNPGFSNFGLALWWTSMRVITAGSDFWPLTTEGRFLAFIIALFGYAIFGYVTATLATFFIGRDAEEKDAPLASSKEIEELKKLILLMSDKLKKDDSIGS